MRIFFTIMLASSVVFFSSCMQTTKNYLKTTKHYYYEYVNKPATLDTGESSYTPGEEVLATNLPPLENVLSHFKRTLFNLDSAPSDEWMNSFISRFPWIGGVALVDTEGKVLHEWPASYMKQLDYSFIKERNKKIAARHLIGIVKDDALGPEVYVATEVMQRAKPLGHFVVHFDPRVLFSNVEGSSEFMVAAPGAILWPGKYEVTATPVSGSDWSKLTASDTSGSVKNAAGKFVWYSYYIGTLPLVFAAPDAGAFPEAPGQMDKLASYRSAGASSEAISMSLAQESGSSEPGDHSVVTPPRNVNATARHEKDLTAQENPEATQAKGVRSERKRAKSKQVQESNSTSISAPNEGTTSTAPANNTKAEESKESGSTVKSSSHSAAQNSTAPAAQPKNTNEGDESGLKETKGSDANKTAPVAAPANTPAVSSEKPQNGISSGVK